VAHRLRGTDRGVVVAPATALGEAALLARAARGLPLIALREGLDPPMLQRALAAVRDRGWMER
jgi:hypothetical protein